jgi:hypothetical protein
LSQEQRIAAALPPLPPAAAAAAAGASSFLWWLPMRLFVHYWLIDDQLARLFPISSHIPSAHFFFFFFLFLILLSFCCCCFFFFFSLLLLLSAELYQIPANPDSQAIRAQESSG